MVLLKNTKYWTNTAVTKPRFLHM